MSLILIIWLVFGIAHWANYMLRYNDMMNLLDFVVLLPFMLLTGPFLTLRKLWP